VDSVAECDQLNLAHVARKIEKEETIKPTNASTHLVQYRFKIREGSPQFTSVHNSPHKIVHSSCESEKHKLAYLGDGRDKTSENTNNLRDKYHHC